MTINEAHKRIIVFKRWKHIELEDVWVVGMWNDYEVFAGQGDGQGSAQFFLAGEDSFREATNEEMLKILLELNRLIRQEEQDG